MPETAQSTAAATSSMRPHVRPARPGELDTIADLHAAAFPPHAVWTRQAFADLLATPGTFALVCGPQGEDDVLAGFILMRVAGTEAEVLTIAVDPAGRRQGAGRGLVLGGITACLAAGCTSVFLEVAADNDAARALYASLGFETAGTRKAYYRRPEGGAVDGIVMRWSADADQSQNL